MTTDATRPIAAGAGRASSGWLRSLGRLFRRDAPSPGARTRLAIDGLQDACAALAPGGLYVVYAQPRTCACDALLWNTARAAPRRKVTVVLAGSRAEAARQLVARGFVSGEPARGWPRGFKALAMPRAATPHPLTVLSSDPPTALAPDASAALARAPLATLEPQPGVAAARIAARPSRLRALKPALRTNSLCLVEHGQRWFSWDDPSLLAREIRLLARWCARRQVALVLVFAPGAGDAQPGHDAAAHAAADAARLAFHSHLAGIARLDQTRGEIVWHVDFWRSAGTLAAAETAPLRFDHAGRLAVARGPVQPLDAAHELLAPDEERVVVAAAVVAGQAWVPPEWLVFADNAAVAAACAEARAATVVLGFTDPAQAQALCATIHTLRQGCGRALKIVVVERGAAMRLPYECLVLKLGADLIVGRDLPFSRIFSPLRSLQGQVHTRPAIDDYRAALAAAVHDPKVVYLPVRAFCAQVLDVLARNAVLGLPHVLVTLALRPEIGHLDALHACVPRRAGDIITADAARLYVFLFACRVPDADAVLRRMLHASVAQLFATVAVAADAAIGDEIAALARRQQREPSPDYSDLQPFADNRAATPSALPGAEACATRPSSQLQAGGAAAATATPLRAPAHPSRGAEHCVMPLHRRESA